MLFEIYLSEYEVEIAEWGIAYGLQKILLISMESFQYYNLKESAKQILFLKYF